MGEGAPLGGEMSYAQESARALIAERGLSGARAYVTAELNFLTSRINHGAFQAMIREARDQQSYWHAVAQAILEETEHADAS